MHMTKMVEFLLERTPFEIMGLEHLSREQLRLSMRSKLRQSASRQNHSVTVRDCVPLSPHSLPKPLQAP